jgi:hypothetical protein
MPPLGTMTDILGLVGRYPVRCTASAANDSGVGSANDAPLLC